MDLRTAANETSPRAPDGGSDATQVITPTVMKPVPPDGKPPDEKPAPPDGKPPEGEGFVPVLSVADGSDSSQELQSVEGKSGRRKTVDSGDDDDDNDDDDDDLQEELRAIRFTVEELSSRILSSIRAEFQVFRKEFQDERYSSKEPEYKRRPSVCVPVDKPLALGPASSSVNKAPSSRAFTLRSHKVSRGSHRMKKPIDVRVTPERQASPGLDTLSTSAVGGARFRASGRERKMSITSMPDGLTLPGSTVQALPVSSSPRASSPSASLQSSRRPSKESKASQFSKDSSEAKALTLVSNPAEGAAEVAGTISYEGCQELSVSESLRDIAGKRTLQSNALWIVRSSNFDYLSATMVISNSITIGVQTDYMAKEGLMFPPLPFRILDLFFCVVFTSELCLRFLAFGRMFFKVADWHWNSFDLLLVGLQVLDELLSSMASSAGLNLSFLRILRILRLVRIMRMIRILRLISELRTIVASIMGSMRSLFWTVVLIFMLVYVFAVYLTQLVLDFRVELAKKDDAEMNPHDVYLIYCFGSLGRSILSLYQGITGGMDWDQMAEPLMDRISLMLGFVMAFFIALALLALMNVVTGVFVESALQSAKEDRTEYMLAHVKQLFAKADPEGSGHINWDRFEACLDQPFMQAFFDAIDVDVADAHSIFALLDSDDSGDIDLDEFLNGCLSLHGPAKAIHVATLMYEARLSSRFQLVNTMNIRAMLQKVLECLPSASGAITSAPVVVDASAQRRKSWCETAGK